MHILDLSVSVKEWMDAGESVLMAAAVCGGRNKKTGGRPCWEMGLDLI